MAGGDILVIAKRGVELDLGTAERAIRTGIERLPILVERGEKQIVTEFPCLAVMVGCISKPRRKEEEEEERKKGRRRAKEREKKSERKGDE